MILSPNLVGFISMWTVVLFILNVNKTPSLLVTKVDTSGIVCQTYDMNEEKAIPANSDDRYKRIWEFFNDNGQAKFGLAHYYLRQADTVKALQFMEELLEVWDDAFKIKQEFG